MRERAGRRDGANVACRGTSIRDMSRPQGFAYTRHADGTVTITHHGREATMLRGPRATRFLAEVEAGDPQLVMARWTGNYRRGNERTARNHPRNRR
ncbi:hypothetical protein GCM10017771_38340 [Streptomyces capitiformicae]|uniref:Uncharacterized protein n=2 Tax=Streptomyces capitiformicae TaxID=2014920 RepID=A0A919GR50_9ACTN|nr:hypothetical protein GCM10017771_38340 [Streptomyces capitiformicae]